MKKAFESIKQTKVFEPLKLNLQFFAETKAADLINPEVMAPAISAKLAKAIRFTPYATIDNTLKGGAGDTITRPKYAYIGPAKDLTEGVPMDTDKLSMTTTTVTVKEAGKAVEITEKAIITNVNGTVNEAVSQIGMAMGDKVDLDYLATLEKSLLTTPGSPTSIDTILAAIDVFDLEDDKDMVLFINNKDYTKLVKSLFNVGGAVQQTAITKAEVAELVGIKDIVKTKRVAEGKGYLQLFGAVEIVKKKEVELKKDSDILKRTVVLAANSYYTTNLFNDNGVVKFTGV